MFGSKKIRYAIAGLGHIAQNAVLPAFKHASENSELTTLISSDPEKLAELSTQYKVPNTFFYEDFNAALKSDLFDALYIALPNDMHKHFAVKAAQAGKHVLCEKPMALNEEDCLTMIEAAELSNVKLMIAYRLHFEPTNMKAVQIIESGQIGETRLFNSSFTMQVREGNIRTQSEHGGGPLYDIGIYCVNAARYLFKSEPLQVLAMTARSNDPRFREVEESIGVTLRFPNECIASFVCSFGSKDVSRYEVIGTDGTISLEPAYDYVEKLSYKLVRGDKEEHHTTPMRDQFAPELVHFSKCIIKNEQPRPSGYEGLADIRVINAIQESASSGRTINIIQPDIPGSQPNRELVMEKPAVKKPRLINAESGSK